MTDLHEHDPRGEKPMTPEERDADSPLSPLESPLEERPAVGTGNAVLPADVDEDEVTEGDTAEDEARARQGR
jgi:hypothetical protein